MFKFGTFYRILASMGIIGFTGQVKCQCDTNLLAQCAVKLLNVSNLMRMTVYVTMSPNVSHNFRTELLFATHRHYNPTLLLHHFEIELFNPNQYILPHAYLVAARSVPDLVDHLDTINVTGISWQPQVNFIVALETPTEVTHNALEPVYRRFWFNNMFQSVLLVPELTGNGTTVNALAWYPFRQRCGEYHMPKKVNTCVRLLRDDDGGHNNSGLWNVSNVFGGRIPETFNYNCKVKIAGFHWPPMTLLSNHTPRRMIRGMDVEVVKLMGRIGHVKLELSEVEHNQRWGVMFANGTWNGGFGQLSRHRADFLIGGGIMTYERLKRFDSAPGRQVIRFPIYTPLPRKLPYWQNMLKVFSGSFWLTLFVVFALTSGLLWLSGKHLPSEKRTFADFGHCLIISWAILCSVSSDRQPTSVSSKMIYLSWVIYMLHISAVYTSMQLIYLYKPKYERPMRTINEVKESGLLACSVPTFIPIARSMSAENFNMTEFTPCTDMLSSANRLLRQKDIIILDPEDHFEALVSGSIKKVNKVDEMVIVYNIGIYMQKGNPFKDILTKAQITAYETGLHVKWRGDASPSRPLKKDRFIKVKKLNVNELQGAFMILICGLCIGLMIFIFEYSFRPN